MYKVFKSDFAVVALDGEYAVVYKKLEVLSKGTKEFCLQDIEDQYEIYVEGVNEAAAYADRGY
jgi:hypothetical protein